MQVYKPDILICSLVSFLSYSLNNIVLNAINHINT